MRAERFYADTKKVAVEDLPLGTEKLERQDGDPIRILVKP
jgi:hypothetical protein